MPRRPIRRTAPDEYAMELDPSTRDLLDLLCTQLDDLLVSDSPLLRRLFPPPYGDDEERNEGYAALAVPELIEHRRAGLATMRSTLRAEQVSEDQLMAWMRAVNDIRLVLGTLLGIEDDGVAPEVPDELVATYRVYEMLGALLELTVEALAG